MSFDFKPCTKEQFVAAITSDPADKFAKTFVAKADMLGRWDACVGAFTDDGKLAGAVLWTFSKRTPVVCNLQLLHTFAAFRGYGVGRALMEHANGHAYSSGAQYFRVSSEPESVGFYEKIGYNFWGKQKSGCQLCIFKMPNDYDPNDSVIHAAIHRKGKGGVVELNEFYHQQIDASIENTLGLSEFMQ